MPRRALQAGNTDTVNPTPKIPPGGKKVPTTAPHAPIAPMDEHNTKLVDGVHPPDYVNPAAADKYDLVVIGAGVAGLLSVIMGKVRAAPAAPAAPAARASLARSGG